MPADFAKGWPKMPNHLAAWPFSNSPFFHRFLLPPSKFVGLEVTFPANLWKEKICWCKLHTMYLHVTSSAFSLYLSLFFHFLLCQAPVLFTQWNSHLHTNNTTLRSFKFHRCKFDVNVQTNSKLKQINSNSKFDL